MVKRPASWPATSFITLRTPSYASLMPQCFVLKHGCPVQQVPANLHQVPGIEKDRTAHCLIPSRIDLDTRRPRASSPTPRLPHRLLVMVSWQDSVSRLNRLALVPSNSAGTNVRA